MPSLIFKAEVC